MKGGSKVVVQPHRHDGVFVAKGKEDALCTKNMVVGESVYGEKRISVQVTSVNFDKLQLLFFGLLNENPSDMYMHIGIYPFVEYLMAE